MVLKIAHQVVRMSFSGALRRPSGDPHPPRKRFIADLAAAAHCRKPCDTVSQSLLCIEGERSGAHGSTTGYEHLRVDFSVGAKL